MYFTIKVLTVRENMIFDFLNLTYFVLHDNLHFQPENNFIVLSVYIKLYYEAWEYGLEGYSLLLKHKDMSSLPPIQKLGMTASFYNPSADGWRQEDPGSSLASHSNRSSELCVQRDPVSVEKGREW